MTKLKEVDMNLANFQERGSNWEQGLVKLKEVDMEKEVAMLEENFQERQSNLQGRVTSMQEMKGRFQKPKISRTSKTFARDEGGHLVNPGSQPVDTGTDYKYGI